MAKKASGKNTIMIGGSLYRISDLCAHIAADARISGQVAYFASPGGGLFKSGNRTVAIHKGDRITSAANGMAVSLPASYSGGGDTGSSPSHSRATSYLDAERPFSRSTGGSPTSHSHTHPHPHPHPHSQHDHPHDDQRVSTNTRVVDENSEAHGFGHTHVCVAINDLDVGKIPAYRNARKRAYAMWDARDYEGMEKSFDDVLRINPHDRYAAYARCYALDWLDRYPEAHALIDKYLAWHPNQPFGAVIKAYLLDSELKYEEGLEFVDKQLVKRPHDIDMVCYKINFMKELNRFDDAIDFINSELDSEQWQAAANIDGYRHSENADVDHLVSDFKSSVRYNLDYPFSALEESVPKKLSTIVHMRISQIYALAHDLLNKAHSHNHALRVAENSIKVIKRCKETGNTVSHIKILLASRLYAKANTLCLLGRQDDALTCYDECDGEENFGTPYAHKGYLLHYMGRNEEALKSYEDALRVDPDEAGFLTGMSNVLSALSRFEEALEHADKALDDDLVIDKPYALRAKARALCGLDRYYDALECVNDALDDDDEDIDALELKIKCLNGINKPRH